MSTFTIEINDETHLPATEADWEKALGLARAMESHIGVLANIGVGLGETVDGVSFCEGGGGVQFTTCDRHGDREEHHLSTAILALPVDEAPAAIAAHKAKLAAWVQAQREVQREAQAAREREAVKAFELQKLDELLMKHPEYVASKIAHTGKVS